MATKLPYANAGPARALLSVSIRFGTDQSIGTGSSNPGAREAPSLPLENLATGEPGADLEISYTQSTFSTTELWAYRAAFY